MSVNKVFKNSAYGLNNPLQGLAPQPIIAKRDPKATDKAEFGVLWINELTDAYWVLTSTSSGDSVWTAQSAGSATQSSLQITGGAGTVLTVDAGGNTLLGGTLAVSGDTVMTGGLIVNGTLTANGSFDITDTGLVSFNSTSNTAPAIYLHADGGTTETIEIYSDQGTAQNSVDIHSDVGGIVIEATGSASNSAVNLVALAGGFQLDAVKASALNVVGAGEDLQLNSTGGSIAVTATESVAGAVNISASGVAGTILLQGAGGATLSTTNSAISINSGTGTVSISTDSTTATVNIATGASDKTARFGSIAGASQTIIQSGTAGVQITSAGTGDITLASADTVLIDAAGVLELNSSAGIIGIGNDAVAAAINIGTGAADRDITIGNVTASTTIVLNTPVGTTVSIPKGINIGVSITSGTGSPNAVVTAAKGSLFLRTDGASGSEVAYVNTDGTTAWSALTA